MVGPPSPVQKQRSLKILVGEGSDPRSPQPAGAWAGGTAEEAQGRLRTRAVRRFCGGPGEAWVGGRVHLGSRPIPDPPNDTLPAHTPITPFLLSSINSPK